MKFKAVLFDLDGTLLPMDNDLFVKVYFGKLGATLAELGMNPEVFKKALWSGIGNMQANDGRATNEQIFWESFEAVSGKLPEKLRGGFDYFYENIFPSVEEVTGKTPISRMALDFLHEKNIPCVLATAPVFPETATRQRAAWNNIRLEDFVLVTTFENSRHTKPSLDYYRDILNELKLSPEEVLLIGNDASDDLAARELGITVYLITDHLINRKGVDISAVPHGSYPEMLEYLKNAFA